MKKETYTFVLVHGSWHTGDLLEPVAKFLRTKEHATVHTPTMAGHGKDANKRASHDDQVASIISYITENDLHDFVLVGHSYGGTVISKVAEAMADRIRRLVFWSAFVLEDGHSVYDEIPSYSQALFDQLREASTDGGIMLPFPMWREGFMNDADLALAKETYAKLSSEPESAFYDKLDLKKFYSLIEEQKVACSYLYGTVDTALPLGDYAWIPRYPNRLGLYRLVEIEGGHEVLFTNPRLAAQKIFEAGRD